MYVGRIVAVGMNSSGEPVGMYRVSSRSFPNRETRLVDDRVSVMPKAGFEGDLNKSPYIAYNCLRLSGKYAVVSNGSQTDPIAEKILMGTPVRDALSLSLLALDYEKDDYNTPRIAGVVETGSNAAYLGIVTDGSLVVRKFELNPGEAYYVATYEHTVPSSHLMDSSFDAVSANSAKEYVFSKGKFAELEKPVTAAAVILKNNGEVEISAEC